jgi:hypothetical protein
MAGLAMPIEYSAQMNVSGNGLILVTEDYSETGPLAKATQAQTSTYDSKIVRWRGRREMAKMASVGQKALPFEVTKPNLQRDYMQAVQKVTTATQQIEIENQLREQRNARIEEVLTTVTGQQFSDGPKKWWTAWMQFNDVYSPETLPEYRREIEQDYSRYLEFRTMSCFVAGTPVWTQAGPVAIEKIKIGDLVLSQDPHTGEISYRPVIDRTVRPPCGTVKMVVNDETIVATRGHRFWISGQGWEMAKFLKAGLPIVAIGGSLKLESANPDQEAEAYNLEVGEFHTYFVGKNRILAHDNTCPQPTTNVLPGVSPRAEFAPQLALKN